MSTAVKERPAKPVQVKRNLEKERDKLFAKLQEINHAIQKAETGTAKSERQTLAKLRAALGWSRNQSVKRRVTFLLSSRMRKDGRTASNRATMQEGRRAAHAPRAKAQQLPQIFS